MPGLEGDDGGDDKQDDDGDIGGLADDITETAEALLGMVETPCGEYAGGDHRRGQTKAESEDEGESERELFQLQADDEHRDGRGTGHEPASEAEHDDLPRGDGASGKALLDLERVHLFVVILELAFDHLDFFEIVIVRVIVVVMIVGMIMRMAVVMMMVVMPVVVIMGGLEIATGAPEHPEGHAGDEDGGGELEVGLGILDIELAAVMEADRGDDPDKGAVRDGGGKSEENGLRDGSPHRDDEGGHHGLGVSRLQAMQGT